MGSWVRSRARSDAARVSAWMQEAHECHQCPSAPAIHAAAGKEGTYMEAGKFPVTLRFPQYVKGAHASGGGA